MKFALALMIAVQFWGDRGVHIPCHPIPVSGADALLPKDQDGYPEAMAAYPNTCRILISSIAGNIRHNENLAPLYCGEVAHEVGHLGGLPHSTTGIMGNHAIYDDDIPYECYHWRTWAKERGIHVRPRHPGF